MRPAAFDGAFQGLGAGGEQENFLERFGQNRSQLFHQARADFAGEAIVGEELGLRRLRDRLDDFAGAMAGVGNQHARGPVDPLVAVGVVDLESLGAVTHDGGLAAHGDGLVLVEPLENRDGLRRGQFGDDAAVSRFDARDALGNEIEFSGHLLNYHYMVRVMGLIVAAATIVASQESMFQPQFEAWLKLNSPYG